MQKGRVGTAADYFVSLFQTADTERTRSYRDLVRHIASLPYRQGEQIGHSPALHYSVLWPWFKSLEAVPSVFAATLALDAVDKLATWTAEMEGSTGSSGVSSSDKKDVTRFVGGYAVEFKVPEGCIWRRYVQGQEEMFRQAGFSGHAVIQRCHLSQSIYFQPLYVGLALSQRRETYDDGASDQAIGFSVPCSYYPDAIPSDKGELQMNGMPVSFGARYADVLIPFGWISRIFNGWGYNEPWPGWAGIAKKAIETIPLKS